MRKNLFGFIIKSQNITNFTFLDFLSHCVLRVQNRYKEIEEINKGPFFNFKNKWFLNALTK